MSCAMKPVDRHRRARRVYGDDDSRAKHGPAGVPWSKPCAWPRSIRPALGLGVEGLLAAGATPTRWCSRTTLPQTYGGIDASQRSRARDFPSVETHPPFVLPSHRFPVFPLGPVAFFCARLRGIRREPVAPLVLACLSSVTRPGLWLFLPVSITCISFLRRHAPLPTDFLHLRSFRDVGFRT